MLRHAEQHRGKEIARFRNEVLKKTPPHSEITFSNAPL